MPCPIRTNEYCSSFPIGTSQAEREEQMDELTAKVKDLERTASTLKESNNSAVYPSHHPSKGLDQSKLSSLWARGGITSLPRDLCLLALTLASAPTPTAASILYATEPIG